MAIYFVTDNILNVYAPEDNMLNVANAYGCENVIRITFCDFQLYFKSPEKAQAFSEAIQNQ